MHVINIRQKPNAKITQDSVVLITDVFEEDALPRLLVGQDPAYVINDHYSNISIQNRKIYTLPLFLAKNIKSISINPNQEYVTQHIFNFIINKKQINRYLCIKLVELFNLSSYDYTWSGIGAEFDMSDVLIELAQLGNNSPITAEQRSMLLKAAQLPAKFFNSLPGNDQESISHITYLNNNWTWHNGLSNIFSSSAISLITESVAFSHGAVFTEKTAYAVLGKTFPIWIGGYGQAHEFKKMGFDVFDDIIDHSYQYYDTLIERCYYAFDRNKEILSNFEYASNMRNTHMNRLQDNQTMLKAQQLDDFCKKQISQWPAELQQVIDEQLQNWLTD